MYTKWTILRLTVFVCPHISIENNWTGFDDIWYERYEFESHSSFNFLQCAVTARWTQEFGKWERYISLNIEFWNYVVMATDIWDVCNFYSSYECVCKMQNNKMAAELNMYLAFHFDGNN